jgi:TPR repeat protein
MAQNNLGVMHKNGLAPLPMDNKLAINRENEMAKKLAMHWYTKAAEQDFAEVQFRLGVLYDDFQVQGDYQLVISWEVKAADNGHANAHQYSLGWMHDGT